MAVMVETLASVATATGDVARAAILLGTVNRLWTAAGCPGQMNSPAWRGPHQECERQARRVLGDDAFGAAFARGAELDIDDAIAYALGEKPATKATTPAATDAEEAPLTRRELQVAELVAGGLTNKQIADKLVISQRTAEGHVERALTKLGFTKRVQLARWLAEQRNPLTP